jgi:hypothetical protein
VTLRGWNRNHRRLRIVTLAQSIAVPNTERTSATSPAVK